MAATSILRRAPLRCVHRASPLVGPGAFRASPLAGPGGRRRWRSLSTAATKLAEEESPAPTSVLPGVAASAAVMTAGFCGAEYLGAALLAFQGVSGGSSPVSGIPVSIVLGMGIRAALPAVESPALRAQEALAPGLKLVTTYVLRGGIICVGAKLSAIEMATLGAAGVPVVALSIGTGLAFASWAGPKLGISTRQSSLIAAGTSICGVTAITACAPAIGATKKETSVAVANVVAFGTLGMLAYPYLAHASLETSQQIGTFLGLAIHDTSQVMGAALTYNQVYGDEVALQTAAVTKLTRNLFLAGVIPGMVWANRATAAAKVVTGEPQSMLDKVAEYVPLFVLGFVGMSAVRSTGDAMLAHDMLAFGVLDGNQWKQAASFVGSEVGGHYLLGSAMAGVGLSTSVAALRGVGLQPFLLGSSTALCVGGTAFASVSVLGGLGVM